MDHDDDTRTSQQPGAGTDAEGSAGGPGRMAPGGGMTVGSGEPKRTGDEPPAPGDEAARAATGDIPAQDAASADVDEPSTTGNRGIGETGASGPAG